MFPISHGVPAPLLSFGPALLALAAAAATGWLCRGKGHQAWRRPAMSLACLLGWAALEGVGRWRGAVLFPSAGPGLLVMPAAAVTLLEALLAWRRGRNERWLAVAAALLTGWWLARATAGPGESWRVGIVVALLVGVVAWAVKRRAARALALALALAGGAVATGFPLPWIVAAAVLAVVAAVVLAFAADAAVPSALIAAVVAGLDLSRGRLPRGHLDAADLVCLLALAAPFLAAAAEARLAKRWRMLAPVLGAAAAVALGWGLRRAVL